MRSFYRQAQLECSGCACLHLCLKIFCYLSEHDDLVLIGTDHEVVSFLYCFRHYSIPTLLAPGCNSYHFNAQQKYPPSFPSCVYFQFPVDFLLPFLLNTPAVTRYIHNKIILHKRLCCRNTRPFNAFLCVLLLLMCIARSQSQRKACFDLLWSSLFTNGEVTPICWTEKGGR